MPQYRLRNIPLHSHPAGIIIHTQLLHFTMRPNARLLSSSIWRQGPVALSSSPPTKEFICASCRTQQAAHRRRQFSWSPSQRAPASPSPPAPSGLVALSSRRLIEIKGPDAAKFLQGIVTQNVLAQNNAAARHSDPCYSAILNASGRVLFDVFIYPDTRLALDAPGCNFLLEVDADQAEGLEKHLRRYKLRAKVSVGLVAPGEVTVWHAWSSANSLSVEHDDETPHGTKLVNSMRDPRAPGLGHRIVKAGEEPPLVHLPRVAASRPDEEEAAYRVRRYLYGVPEGPDELLQTKALPLEGNLDVMGGVDFRKGCYVGQELTIRTKHQGIVRKRILPVMLYGGEGEATGGSSGPPETLEYRPGLSGVDAADIPKDASIGRAGKKGRSAGKWLRGVGNVGLALCRLETMTDVVLPGETAATSYDPADEFVVETQPGEDGSGGTRVKVKAFVPEWLRKGLDAAQHR